MRISHACLCCFALTVIGCNGNNNIGSETGNSCGVVDDCYKDLDPATLSGAVICLDRVSDGYCTHLCAVDADCCGADGECDDDAAPQVCAPFESTGQRMCFLSCEGEPEDYCGEYLSSDFGCSSTGGGSENRKVCSPKG